ncbi:MAG TPA: tetratricopeptide repeat protein [Thermoanaerobaculia bacterium]|nr:tetratricopeptide repeat protein [Thermoanaerobaculia bacterium]
MNESIRILAERLAREDTEARETLEPLLGSPAAFRRANLAGNPRMHTAGAVRQLCAESRRLRERQPMHALVVADTAIAIVDLLSPTSYPSLLIDELRGDAWYERANVLRYLGRYPEALDALDLAARAFERSPTAAYAGALVDYLRAVLFVELDRYGDARPLARKSARVFRQFGESERYLHAKIVEASILFHEDRMRESRALFLSLVERAKEIAKPETLARLFANIANCDVRLEQFDSAESYFARALSLYEAVGNESGKIRTRWNLGTLRIAAGDLEEGLLRLREARREFEQLGAHTDAALVTLEIVEALLSTESPRDAREAAELCAGLADSFAAVGMTGNALTALSFLHHAFAAGRATPQLVRRIRQYIETRPDQDGRPFVPPA